MSVLIDGFDASLDAGKASNSAATPAGPAAMVWVVGCASLFLIALLFAAGQATLLRFSIPAAATITALTLYTRRPIAFIHFTLWTWFLTPLLRRIVDWRFGFQDQNVVLLAPFLVTAIAGITVLRERRNVAGPQVAPFYLCIAGILYGFLVGVIRWELHDSLASSFATVLYGLLTWLVPVLFGLHLYLRWQQYDQQKQAVITSFKWAVLLLGIYGIYQYVAPPAWDRAWLEGLPGGYENMSFGRPFPYEIRVWSTLNAPGPLASVLLAGLILLFGAKIRHKMALLTAGYLCFLLSMVRTSWLAWLLAMMLLLASYRGAALRRFVFGLLALPLCVLPLMLFPQIHDSVQDRMNSMQNLGKDDSFQDRMYMYEHLTSELLRQPAGLGLLNSSLTIDGAALDSGLLQTAFMLGFTGSALYGAGILMACLTASGVGRRAFLAGLGPEEIAFRAILFATLAKVIGENVFVNVGGAILWMCVGLFMSSVHETGVKARVTTNHLLDQGSQAA